MEFIIATLFTTYILLGFFYLLNFVFEFDPSIFESFKLKIWQILLALFFLPFTLVGIVLILFVHLVFAIETTSFGRFFKKEITFYKKRK